MRVVLWPRIYDSTPMRRKVKGADESPYDRLMTTTLVEDIEPKEDRSLSSAA